MGQRSRAARQSDGRAVTRRNAAAAGALQQPNAGGRAGQRRHRSLHARSKLTAGQQQEPCCQQNTRRGSERAHVARGDGRTIGQGEVVCGAYLRGFNRNGDTSSCACWASLIPRSQEPNPGIPQRACRCRALTSCGIIGFNPRGAVGRSHAQPWPPQTLRALQGARIRRRAALMQGPASMCCSGLNCSNRRACRSMCMSSVERQPPCTEVEHAACCARS